MSAEYANQDPIEIAKQAERDLNSTAAQGETKGGDDSTKESGVDTSVEQKFPGSEVKYGSEASGAGGNRDIPEGGVDPATGQTYKAKDFEGPGGPEDQARMAEQTRGGDNDVGGNVKG